MGLENWLHPKHSEDLGSVRGAGAQVGAVQAGGRANSEDDGSNLTEVEEAGAHLQLASGGGGEDVEVVADLHDHAKHAGGVGEDPGAIPWSQAVGWECGGKRLGELTECPWVWKDARAWRGRMPAGSTGPLGSQGSRGWPGCEQPRGH